MANEKNLIPLTTKKAREIGRKGGIASGKAKREQKTFAQIFKSILNEETEVVLNGKKVKISKKDLLARDLMNKTAQNIVKNSTLNGLKHIQATIGEAPIEKVEQTNLNIEAKPKKKDVQELKKKCKEIFGIDLESEDEEE